MLADSVRDVLDVVGDGFRVDRLRVVRHERRVEADHELRISCR